MWATHEKRVSHCLRDYRIRTLCALQKKKKTGKYKFRTVIVGPLCMIMTYTYFICICCFADLAATRHALGVSCVPNGTFWAHEQCKAEPKGLCQPQVLLCSGGGSSDDISIFLHASSLQHNTFLAKQNEIRINLGNGGSGKKTLISSDCLVWIRFFFLFSFGKPSEKLPFPFDCPQCCPMRSVICKLMDWKERMNSKFVTLY